MAASRIKNKYQFNWHHLLPLSIIALTLYVIIPRLSQFSSSIEAIKTADLRLVAVAYICILASVFSAAIAYKILSFTRFPYAEIVLTQFASMFINRLLPAGLGGISLFIDFFYRHKHSFGKASAVVAVNNSLGLLSHITLFIFCSLFLDLTLPKVPLPAPETWIFTALIIVTVCVAISIAYHFVRSGKIGAVIRELGRTLSSFKNRPVAIMGGYLFNLGNTLSHVLAMTVTIAAFGLPISIPIALIVLSGGVAAATVSPTPGGLLASEAGIAAVLVAYGVPLGVALAIALTYRFVSYWMPIIPGIIAFLIARKRRLV